MKTLQKFFALLFISTLIVGCSSDDDGTAIGPTGETKTYTLSSVADPSIFGTATFIKNNDNTTTVEIDLQGTPAGGTHPAHIHMNTAAEGGDIAVTLGTVDGTTGFSSKLVTQTDNGTPITYDQLLNFDGYINVHLSPQQLDVIVAQGDIGQNELTGGIKTYTLEERAVPGISGTATFEQRVNGEALATLNLQNTPADGSHPAHIHMNTATEGGQIIFTFNPVNGATGMSKTNVAALDDGTEFGFGEVLNVDGYVNVHLSANDLNTVVAQGDIGQNELTGESVTYALSAINNSGVNGTVTFAERLNTTTYATIELTGTSAGGNHPAHIHASDIATGGPIRLTFNNIDGAHGMSWTQINALDDGTPISYSQLLLYDGYVNVHTSPADLTVVTQGNIGSNAP